MPPAPPAVPPAGETRLMLDPFGLWPDAAGPIAGLGGVQPGVDPQSVFHTAYREFAAGPMEFNLRFEGLSATRGSLMVIVHSLDGAGEHRPEKVVYAALETIAAGDGRYRLTFDLRADRRYAIQGRAPEDTDATAAGLAIECDRRQDQSPRATALAKARTALFPTRCSGRLARLVTHGDATLENPVSQMCTAAQMDDPLYALWLQRMGQHAHRHRKQWEFVYVAQALAHHGMLQPGMRGVGFGVGVEPLPAMFAAMGVATVATDLAADDARATAWSLTHQHGRALEDLRFPTICSDAAFDAHVRFEPADMTAIPDHLRDFDFCWSSCAFEHLGSIAAGLAFVERSLETLRPGGLAVHTTELNLTSNLLTVSRGSTILFRRRDFERLALILDARGHQVMPLNWDQGTHRDDRFVDMPPYSSDIHLKVALQRYVATSFGIIVRKAG